MLAENSNILKSKENNLLSESKKNKAEILDKGEEVEGKMNLIKKSSKNSFAVEIHSKSF